MSGLDEYQDWQRDEYEAILVKKSGNKGWEDEAESRAERQALAEKLVGMGLADVEDGREECQGSETVMAPQRWNCATSGTESNKENQRPSQKG